MGIKHLFKFLRKSVPQCISHSPNIKDSHPQVKAIAVDASNMLYKFLVTN